MVKQSDCGEKQHLLFGKGLCSYSFDSQIESGLVCTVLPAMIFVFFVFSHPPPAVYQREGLIVVQVAI